MNRISMKARAKINLGLDVIRKREDGYHEVKMIMQTIGIYDRVIIKKIKEKEIRVSTNLSYLPNNENNLVYKAAKLMMEQYDIPGGVDIELEKFIPVAAGLAGGSSDAAATMVGMNLLFNLKVRLEELKTISVKIGADVPFCIMRGTVLAEGVGEKLTRLNNMPPCPIVIAKPGINVSTKFVYEHLKLDENIIHPDIDGMIKAIEDKDIKGVCSRMSNVLESVTIKEYPVIDEIKQEMIRLGAINAMMSGSGPTVFGIFEDEKRAAACVKELRSKGIARQIYLTETFNQRK